METNGCDVKKVKSEPGKEFELLMFYFTITNINHLDLILQGFLCLLDTENYCRYDFGFIDKRSLIVMNVVTKLKL